MTTKKASGPKGSKPSKAPMFTVEMTQPQAAAALKAAIAEGGDPIELTAAYTEWHEVKAKATGNGSATRRPCPLTRKEFLDEAGSLKVTIQDSDGVTLFNSTLDPKAFATGSFGWGANASVEMNVHDQTVKVQLGLNMTVANSRTAKDE